MTQARPRPQPRPRPLRLRRPGGRGTGRAADALAAVLLVRIVVAVLGMLAALYGAVMLYLHSMSSSIWNFADIPQATIVRYSTPWLVAAAGLSLLAGLLLVAAVADTVRWRRLRRAARDRRS